MRLIKLTMPGDGELYVKADDIIAVVRFEGETRTEVVLRGVRSFFVDQPISYPLNALQPESAL